MIGPGVSQNSSQTINLVEPHGFNIGAAGIPPGIVNNSHMHFTAEVFVCVRGTFRMFIGEDKDQELEVTERDILSVPTWILRGFENVSGDDGRPGPTWASIPRAGVRSPLARRAAGTGLSAIAPVIT